MTDRYIARQHSWLIGLNLLPRPKGTKCQLWRKIFFLETCENVDPVNRKGHKIKTFWFSPSAGVSWSEVGPKKVSRISTDSNLSSSNIPSLWEAPEQTGLVVKIVSEQEENKNTEIFSRLFCCENSKITEDNLQFYHPQWCQVVSWQNFLENLWKMGRLKISDNTFTLKSPSNIF